MADKQAIKKIIAGVVTVAILAVVGYGASLSSKQVGGEATKASGEGLIPIKTWSQTACSSTPWVVADQKGFFKEEGLQIVYTGDTQPGQQIPSVLNGNNDVGSVHPNGLAVAIAAGANIKGVVKAGIDPLPEQDPKLRHMNWYVNPQEHPDIKSFADLNKIAGKIKFSIITNNQCSDFLANTIADRQGVGRDKIEWVTMPDIQAVQALKKGLVTVSGVHPPFYKSMEDAGMVKIADSLDAGLGQGGGIGYYYFTTDYIQKNPEIITKFSQAIIKAQKWANENPEEARKLTEDWIKVPVNAVHYYAADTTISADLVTPWIADLEKAGVIPKGKVTAADLVISENVNSQKIR
ncbi:ABC transporter substrate-binding protein|uniref:ABC-type nitrate/sulfonate/bicarbonate transport system, substrate-binding protein n=1 Tax=Dendrosporobacter quercicolus TaxID=146817 RepID=A0A1G9RZD0_9FIRM|nr:ABC transporter substrate-binding protein [Dendrosporobacter quercicolus]NSL49516.1 ABC transporter substrate-binding protein [Dendrosporobacter quercicolus DSM 1736]SDM28583.1 ABC-type nitrate/sulfonate/bicarbonate transport system, substrate-binding protein [Dendrosporobacter quercicolus]